MEKTPWGHQPVLLKEVLQYVAVYENGTYVDATIGAGGHAESILENTGPASRLIGIDRDETALAICKRRLRRFGGRVHLMRGCFGEMRQMLDRGGYGKVDGVLMDLGVSSMQINDQDRGFSFMNDGPLDMRMDRQQDKTAGDLVNTAGEVELERIMRINGEERFAGRIARAILRERDKKPIRTTMQLAGIIEKAVPRRSRKWRIHPATRTFQSIRMEVNDEMAQLTHALEQAAESLTVPGRMAVISFHSLEDRKVKDFIINRSRGCVCPPNFPFCVCGKRPEFRKITRKVVVPSPEEIAQNVRARSARLRVAEKVA